MFRRLCITAVATAVLLSTAACTDPSETRRAAEQNVLSSRLEEADSARYMAGLAAAAQMRRVEALSAELSDVRTKAADHQRAVEAFMLDHKMAVAALAAGAAGAAASLDDSGRFTEEARQIGAAVGLLAVGWALFNMEEVTQVASELVKAEAAQQAFTSRASALNESLQAQRQELQRAKAGYERLNQQAMSIRTALQAL